MTIKPLGDRVLIKREEAEEKTKSGIVLPGAKEAPQMATVLAVGPGTEEVKMEVKAGDKVIFLAPEYDKDGLPVFDSVKAVFDKVEEIIAAGRAAAVWTLGYGGAAEGIAKMCFGNKIGFEFTSRLSADQLFKPCYGGFIIELGELEYLVIGTDAFLEFLPKCGKGGCLFGERTEEGIWKDGEGFKTVRVLNGDEGGHGNGRINFGAFPAQRYIKLYDCR